MSRKEPTPSGESSETLSVEEVVLEKSRLEALQQAGSLSEENGAMLSILSQWLLHYEKKHAN